MTEIENFSDEQLNAFLDGELSTADRARILSAIRQDKDLRDKLCQLRQVKEMVSLAYSDPPMTDNQAMAAWSTFAVNKSLIAAAASVLLVIGMSAGWLIHDWAQRDPSPRVLLTNNAVNSQQISSDKVLVHLDSMEDTRVRHTFNLLENLLSDAGHQDLKLEVVANAEGLNLLRAGSPYAKRITDLSRRYRNLSFLACGVAMENVKTKEGMTVQLLPEARRVDAALSQILRRLDQGWTYVKS